ncbi:hypothetical protein [Solitalea longa]|uniref:hypothetical protein n=1 Tax=Solitalea longa TaxID=2079460 RepID=UPI0013FD7C86|nr:hypothetical protein [Solitalea longa]
MDSKINLKDYRFLKLRSVILENIISATSPSNDTYHIIVPSGLFYKTICAEFELYHVRAKMQYNDFSASSTISESWKFTTFYYFIFFCNVALHRLLNRGYIYLDLTSASTLSTSLNVLLSDVVNIGTGNWSFRKLSETSSVVTIELKKAGSNVHQLAWQDLKKTLKDFIANSSSKTTDPERSVLENIYKNLRANNDFSPSETRNYLNYVSEVALDEIESKIVCPQPKIESFIKTLTTLNYNNSLASNISFSIIIGQYLFLLNSELVNDLQGRDPKQFKLIRKVV